eukprot:1179223-Rhodomonas_salina.1
MLHMYAVIKIHEPKRWPLSSVIHPEAMRVVQHRDLPLGRVVRQRPCVLRMRRPRASPRPRQDVFNAG